MIKRIAIPIFLAVSILLLAPSREPGVAARDVAASAERDPVEQDAVPWRTPDDPTQPRFRVVQLDHFDNLTNGVVDAETGTGHNLASDGEIICNYELRGRIVKGDYAQFLALLAQNRSRHGKNTPRLCLDSRGGDRRNSIAVAELLIAERIGTAVPDGAICLSGCSLIFLAGSHPGRGELNRFLHVGGRLGFHAPSLYNMPAGRPGDSFTTDEVKEAYDTAVDAIRSMARLGIGNAVNRFPSELFSEMLERGPSEFHYIDTVGKAIRFRIHLYGRSVRPKLDDADFCNVCANIDYGAWEEGGKGEKADRCATAGPVEEKAFPKGKRLVFPFANGHRCAIDVEMKDGKPSGWVRVSEDQGWARGWRLAYWYLHPPNTTLAALRGVRSTCFDSAGRLISRDDTGTKPIWCSIPVIDSRLLRFVRDSYLGHGERNHVVREELLGEMMMYYGKPMPRAEVVKSREAYYARWPERRFELVDGSLQAARFPKPDGGETISASFQYRYTVSRNDQILEGRGEIRLELKPVGESYVITDETGAVTVRK